MRYREGRRGDAEAAEGFRYLRVLCAFFASFAFEGVFADPALPGFLGDASILPRCPGRSTAGRLPGGDVGARLPQRPQHVGMLGLRRVVERDDARIVVP